MRRAVNIQQPSTLDTAEFEGQFVAWLRSELGWRNPSIESIHRPEGTGSSNESLLVEVSVAGRRPPISLVVRMPGRSVTTYFDSDLERQAAAMRWVAANTGVPVPEVVAVAPASSVLGGPFMVMERLEGVAPSDYPGYNVSGFLVDATPESRRSTWEHALDTLARLHTVDIGSIDFLGPGPPGQGLVQLVAYWRASWRWMSESCDVTDFDPLLRWLEATIPSDAPVGLSWGDARIANMLFVGDRVSGVLDWEMVSRGGPLVDLAWWLMFDEIHSVDFGVERLAGLGKRDETIDRWVRAAGLSVEHLTWHEVFVHVQLCLGRTVAFAQRQRAGLPVPGPDDARSVANLLRRIERLRNGL